MVFGHLQKRLLAPIFLSQLLCIILVAAFIRKNTSSQDPQVLKRVADDTAGAAFNYSCVQLSGYQLKRWSPSGNTSNYTWRVMSTVQIERTQPSGFASRCDWVIGHRKVQWGKLPKNTAWGLAERLPRTVFLQTAQLQTFNDKILPCFPPSHRFVLIIGDHDATSPRQTDRRNPSPILSAHDWQAWLADVRILHMFVEHLDTKSPVDRVTPIPLGLNPAEHPQRNPDVAFDSAPHQIQISKRPLRLLFTNRVRNGGKGQWSDRAAALRMCERMSHCVVRQSVPPKRYAKVIQQYPFLLCVHGGGIDPNPNAFAALLAGVIPVMASFPGQSIYDGLPVLITDGVWNETSSFFTTDYLSQKLAEFAPFFEDPVKRATVLDKLSSEHWWKKVEKILAMET